jgi:hypothetical protein
VAPFHQRVAEKLEAVERGEIKRLLIMAPPRHGKSELASRRFPAYYLGKHPDRDVISASCDQDLATDFSRDVREILRSQEYRNVFGAVGLAQDSQAVNRWHVSGRDEAGRLVRGGYVSAGVGTTIIGRGAHLFNIDDPHKSRAEAESEQNRKTTWDWYKSTAYSRLEKDAAIVLTLTRWHEEDLAGMILQQEAEEGGERWEKLVLPAVDGEGNVLWEEKYPRAVLDQIRRVMGEYDWNALYMQRPRPPGGSFFNEVDLLVDGQPIVYPYRPDFVLAIIDTALKTGKEHDGLAVTYFAAVRHGQCAYPLYVLDWDYKQIAGALLEDWLPTVFVRLEELSKQCEARLGSVGAYVEDKVSGTVLLQQGERHGWPVAAIESGLTAMGKSERAINVSPYCTAGQVKFTELAYDKTVTYKGATKNHLLTQVLSFRAGTQETAADDLLDTFTYGCALVLGNRLGF